MKHVKVLSKPSNFRGPALAESFPSIGEKINDLLCKLATGNKCP